MAINHKDIIDSARHEVKGASTALVNRVLKSNGDGTTTFVDPVSLPLITLGSLLEAKELVSQNPTAVDTALQITWGAGTSNADVSVASNGTITILTAGIYDIKFDLNFGRSNNTGAATLLYRLFFGASQLGTTKTTKITGNADISAFSESYLGFFGAGSTLRAEIMRDSSGVNDGGLIAITPIAGWSVSPSAGLRIQRVRGGF